LLTPDLEQRCHYFINSYVDILYRWGYLEKAVELLKLQNFRSNFVHQGIDFGVVCQRCDTQLSSSYCPFCKVIGANCAICHVAVRGLSSFCVLCGHGGHTTHMKDWFQMEVFCATGCGCRCCDAF